MIFVVFVVLKNALLVGSVALALLAPSFIGDLLEKRHR